MPRPTLSRSQLSDICDYIESKFSVSLDTVILSLFAHAAARPAHTATQGTAAEPPPEPPPPPPPLRLQKNISLVLKESVAIVEALAAHSDDSKLSLRRWARAITIKFCRRSVSNIADRLQKAQGHMNATKADLKTMENWSIDSMLAECVPDGEEEDVVELLEGLFASYSRAGARQDRKEASAADTRQRDAQLPFHEDMDDEDVVRLGKDEAKAWRRENRRKIVSNVAMFCCPLSSTSVSVSSSS
jgi:hypothetical protein